VKKDWSYSGEEHLAPKCLGYQASLILLLMEGRTCFTTGKHFYYLFSDEGVAGNKYFLKMFSLSFFEENKWFLQAYPLPD